MKKYFIIACVLIWSMLCGIIGYKFAPDQGTVIVSDSVLSPTVYHDTKTNDCELNKKRAESPIEITGEYKDGVLGVDATDVWKSAHADFSIKCVPNIRRHIIQVSYLFQYHDKDLFSTYGANYLYNLGRVAVGGGVMLSNSSAGLQLCAQVFL